VYLLLLIQVPQLSRNVTADVGFLCDKPAMLWSAIKETLYFSMHYIVHHTRIRTVCNMCNTAVTNAIHVVLLTVNILGLPLQKIIAINIKTEIEMTFEN